VLGFEAGQQVAPPAGVVVELTAMGAVAGRQVGCPPGAAGGAGGGAADGWAGQADVEQVVAGVGHQCVGQPAVRSDRAEQKRRLQAGAAWRARLCGGDQVAGHDDGVRSRLEAVRTFGQDVHRCGRIGERLVADGGGRVNHDR